MLTSEDDSANDYDPNRRWDTLVVAGVANRLRRVVVHTTLARRYLVLVRERHD